MGTARNTFPRSFFFFFFALFSIKHIFFFYLSSTFKVGSSSALCSSVLSSLLLLDPFSMSFSPIHEQVPHWTRRVSKKCIRMQTPSPARNSGLRSRSMPCPTPCFPATPCRVKAFPPLALRLCPCTCSHGARETAQSQATFS